MQGKSKRTPEVMADVKMRQVFAVWMCRFDLLRCQSCLFINNVAAALVF